MAKFYRKKKNIFWSTIAILLVAVIAGSTLAYFLNSNFKSKVNDILKIEKTAEESKKEETTNNSEDTNFVSSAEYQTLKTQLEEAETKLSQMGNPNLLYNGNFKVNQRKSNVYTRADEDIYTADRWGLFQANGEFNVNECSVTGLDETQPTIFGQWLIIEDCPLLGKTLTISATINDVRISRTITLPETITEDLTINLYEGEGFTFRVYVKYPHLAVRVEFLVENGVTITLHKVKLEESEYETKYVERLISEEIAECQRYYQRVKTYAVGFACSTTVIEFFVNTPVEIFKIKKVAVLATPYVCFEDGTRVFVENDNIYFRHTNTNGILLMTKGTDFIQWKPYFVMAGSVEIDGEIYY